jgi:hypothetical protein
MSMYLGSAQQCMQAINLSGHTKPHRTHAGTLARSCFLCKEVFDLVARFYTFGTVC